MTATMEMPVTAEQFAELNRKLDFIADEMAELRRYRQAAEDLQADLTHVAKAAYQDTVGALASLEKQGYFRMAGQAADIAQGLVEAHSPADLDQARASVPHLVEMLRQLTRPESLGALEVILQGFGDVQRTMNAREADVPWTELFRDMRSPEARRGMAVLVKFLRVVGARHAAPTKV